MSLERAHASCGRPLSVNGPIHLQHGLQGIGFSFREIIWTSSNLRGKISRQNPLVSPSVGASCG